MTKIIVTDAGEMEQIVERLHDRFFWLKDVVFQEDERTVRLRTSVLGQETIVKKRPILSRRKIDIVSAELFVQHASSCKITDDAGIGLGDIDQIFLKDQGTVCIRCGLPVKIEIGVSALSLELEIYNRVIESVNYVVYPFSVKKLNPAEFSKKPRLGT